MSGGIRSQSRRRARTWATGMLGGLVFVMPNTAALAEGQAEVQLAHIAAGEQETQPGERSIVIGSGKTSSVDPGVALATDQSEAALEPIANPSEYGLEPELAEEPAAAGGLEPTLADPPEPSDGSTPAYVAVEDKPFAMAEPAGEPVAIDDAEAIDGGFAIADDFTPHATFQAASFNGVIPGESTRADVLSAWGKPLEKSGAAKTFTFDIEGFQTVAVTFAKDRVSSIRVELQEAAPAANLAAKLGLSEFRPAYVKDDDGVIVSTIYPERGVTFGHTPALGAAIVSDVADASADGSEKVHELVMRPIEASAFARRASSAPATAYSNRIADLQTALELDPTNALICCQLSEVKLVIGQAMAAEALAAEAVKLDSASDAYRVQWAKCLQALGNYDESVKQLRTVLEGTTAAQLDRADALETLAQLAALGPAADRARAISLHNKAIELADKLAASEEMAVQRRARRVLLSAHLGMCERIAAGDFQNKDRSIEKWMTRASALAEHMIAEGEADVSLRVQVSLSALRAGGRLNPPVDPALWVEEAEQAAADLEAVLEDAPARDLLHWQLGQVYSLAAEIQHRRAEVDLALEYGELADANMTPLREVRSELPDTDYALGRVYFQIGAVHAVHKQDHSEACQWYDRAADLLLAARPSAVANPGQHGDALVSMGVSYWEIGQRDRAYHLTEAGAEMVQHGVSDGILAESSLAVPQGNLNAMAQALGKIEATSASADGAGPTPMMQGRRHNGQQQMSRAKTSSRMADRRGGADHPVRRR